MSNPLEQLTAAISINSADETTQALQTHGFSGDDLFAALHLARTTYQLQALDALLADPTARAKLNTNNSVGQNPLLFELHALLQTLPADRTDTQRQAHIDILTIFMRHAEAEITHACQTHACEAHNTIHQFVAGWQANAAFRGHSSVAEIEKDAAIAVSAA